MPHAASRGLLQPHDIFRCRSHDGLEHACPSLQRLSHFVDVSVQIVDPLDAAAAMPDHHLGDFVGDAQRG